MNYEPTHLLMWKDRPDYVIIVEDGMMRSFRSLNDEYSVRWITSVPREEHRLTNLTNLGYTIIEIDGGLLALVYD